MIENLPSIYVQREKYPFLPDDVFVPIEFPIVPEEISGRYGINKRGEIKNLVTRKILKSYLEVSNYKIVTFNYRTFNSPKKYRVHRLVASVFINNPNYDVYNVVNHINFNKSDNHVSNLEWVTHEENLSSEKVPPINEDMLITFIGTDKDGNVVYRFNSQNVPNELNLGCVRQSAREEIKFKYKGLDWTKEEPLTKREIDGFSGNVNDYEWHEHWKYPGIYVCKEGFLKGLKGNLLYCCDKVLTRGYVIVNIFGKHYYAHRVIMEYLVKRDLNSDEFVDHINIKRNDNSFKNLRLTDALGNSRNYNTMKQCSNDIVVSDFFGNFIFRGITEDVYKFVFNKDEYDSYSDSSTVLRSNIINNKYICFKFGDINNLYNKLENIYYLVDHKNNKILGAFSSLKSLAKSNLVSGVTVNNISKKKNNLGNELIILKGKEAFDILRSLGYLTAENFNNNLEET